jgi:hypothetical protein
LQLVGASVILPRHDHSVQEGWYVLAKESLYLAGENCISFIRQADCVADEISMQVLFPFIADNLYAQAAQT